MTHAILLSVGDVLVCLVSVWAIGFFCGWAARRGHDHE
jgi:hypothetical protein